MHSVPDTESDSDPTEDERFESDEDRPPRPPTKVPGVWKQIPFPVKVLLIALIVVAAGGIFVANRLTNQAVATLGNGTIEQVIPNNNDKILQQDQVGVRLKSGYRATLAVNGTPVPEDQINQIAAFNEYLFQPGAGKLLSAWPAGQNCVTATYFATVSGPSQAATYTWCFTVI